MFNVIHPAADETREYANFKDAENALRQLEYVTREPGYIKPVAAPVAPVVTAPVTRKWIWQR